MNGSGKRFEAAMAMIVYAFLYGPIIALVIYSFNGSMLATVWGGFSFRWYQALVQNTEIMAAGWLSVKIGLASATVGVVLGTAIGYALARFGRFRGITVYEGMATAPLVVPEVITALALLMMFVSLEQLVGWPQRTTMVPMVLAHATFTTAYVTVVMRSRLVQLDRSLEEAALNLGARPWTVFLKITLPIVAPAIVASWLLAFTLSFDDLIISNFVAGPGMTTLPMLVFSKVRFGVTPEINALSASIVCVFGAIIFGGTMLATRFNRRGK